MTYCHVIEGECIVEAIVPRVDDQEIVTGDPHNPSEAPDRAKAQFLEDESGRAREDCLPEMCGHVRRAAARGLLAMATTQFVHDLQQAGRSE